MKTILDWGVGKLESNVSPKKDAVNTFRYIKSSLSKKGVDVEELILKDIGFVRKECPFCKEKASIKFEVELVENVLFFKKASYYQINGHDNYHCKGGRNNCLGSKLNPNSIDFVSTACNITREEAVAAIHNRNSSPFYRENHKSSADYSKSQKRDLKWYLAKYGDAGHDLFNKKCERIKKHSTYDYHVLKYGKDIANRIREKKAITLKNMIDRYGYEEGSQRHAQWIKKSRLTKECFVEKHGEIEGIKKYEMFCAKRAYRNTFQYFIDKYGFDDGIAKYKDWIDKTSWTKKKHIEKYGEHSWAEKVKKSRNSTYSKESLIFIEKLMGMLKDINFEKVMFGEDEYYQYDYLNKRIYFYDLYCKIGNKKIIVEYDTPFCHPNKFYMTEDEYINWCFPFSELKADEKESYDEQKKLLAEKHGHLVLTAYIKNKNENAVLKEIAEKIKNYVK